MRYENVKYKDVILPVRFHRSKRSANTQMYLHWHEAVEFILVLSGALMVRNGEKKQRVTAGEMFCVHSNHLHFYDLLTP